jgi:hypothetical protein
MSGNNAVAVRRPPRTQAMVAVTRSPRPPGDMIQVPGVISGPLDKVRADLAQRIAAGTLKEHGASYPHPTIDGQVCVDVVLFQPKPAPARNYTRAIVIASVAVVLLGATALLGYLAFLSTASVIGTEAKGLLGCMIVAAIVVGLLGRRRIPGADGCCTVVINVICRRGR